MIKIWIGYIPHNWYHIYGQINKQLVHQLIFPKFYIVVDGRTDEWMDKKMDNHWLQEGKFQQKKKNIDLTSPVTIYLPSLENLQHVIGFFNEFIIWNCLFLRWLYKTNTQLFKSNEKNREKISRSKINLQ